MICIHFLFTLPLTLSLSLSLSLCSCKIALPNVCNANYFILPQCTCLLYGQCQLSHSVILQLASAAPLHLSTLFLLPLIAALIKSKSNTNISQPTGAPCRRRKSCEGGLQPKQQQCSVAARRNCSIHLGCFQCFDLHKLICGDNQMRSTLEEHRNSIRLVHIVVVVSRQTLIKLQRA